jgi:hypothetical protein
LFSIADNGKDALMDLSEFLISLVEAMEDLLMVV